jgi:hypothetical protein
MIKEAFQTESASLRTPPSQIRAAIAYIDGSEDREDHHHIALPSRTLAQRKGEFGLGTRFLGLDRGRMRFAKVCPLLPKV